ncbi:MAG: XRE family transcriptional regulator [Bacteroidales bacterium]
MTEQFKQITNRLKGLRDALDLAPSEMARICNISEKDYCDFESGVNDIPVSTLHQISLACGIDLSTLMFGDEPHMSSYFLTRAGQGAAMERTTVYKYQSLASGFINRKADPFIVTVEPHATETPIYLNTHSGQEFNLVIDGKMLLRIGEKEITLNPGDSIYFDATRPHGMKALDDKNVRFLAIII